MIKKKRKYVKEEIDIRRNRSVNKKYHISVIVIIIIVAIIFIILGLLAHKNTVSIYQYKTEKKSDYEVLLKANEFYQTETLPANLYYASKSIDDFIINFEYSFKGNSKIDMQYDYNVTTDLVGTVKDEYQDKEVWNRNFCLLENKSDKQTNIDTFSVKEKINVDYEKYNNLVHLYENEYEIKLDAILKVHFNIVYYINTEKIEDSIELDIPLTNTVTEVKENYEKESVRNIITSTQKSEIKQYICYAIAGLFIISAIIIFIIEINKNKMTPQEKYEKNINHILKYYRDIIVTVNDKPNFADLKIMEVMTLEDLIDVAEQNNCNIIHYENYLYAIVGEYVYSYILIEETKDLPFK